MKEQFPARTVIQHQVQLVDGLKGVVQLHNEWVIDDRQDFSFGPSPLNLPPSYQMRLFQNLHGKHGSRFAADTLLYQHDLAKGSLAQDSQEGQELFDMGLVGFLLLL